MRHILVAIAATFGAAPAAAGTINFDTFAHGDAVTSVTSDTGIVATVTAQGGINEAWAFDTGLSATRDPDLEGPFAHSGGILGDLVAGRVLMIQEGRRGPDDNAHGGQLTFMFDRAVDLLSFTVIDDARITVRDDTGATFLADLSGHANDNKYDIFSGGGGGAIFSGVRQLTFQLNGSGAIDNLVLREALTPTPVPVPPAIAAMLTALLGLSALSWLKRDRRGSARVSRPASALASTAALTGLVLFSALAAMRSSPLNALQRRSG